MTNGTPEPLSLSALFGDSGRPSVSAARDNQNTMQEKRIYTQKWT